jgi:hypothetical protein
LFSTDVACNQELSATEFQAAQHLGGQLFEHFDLVARQAISAWTSSNELS